MIPSANDIARLRGNGHALTPALNAVPLISVATAQINQSVFTYPLGELTVDSWYGRSAVQIGQLVRIGTTPGSADVTSGIVRKLPTNTTLYIDGKSQGDPAYPRSIINPLVDNLYVTIYSFRPAWGLLSAIRNGVFYKQFDLAYSGEGLNPYPVPVFGGWRQAFVNANGYADLTFDGGNSFAWGVRTIANYEWDLGGGTFSAGSGSAITGRFEPGFYEVTLKVTDTIGRQRTGYRYVWINETDPDSDFAPFNYKYAVEMSSDKQGVTGRELQITISGDINAADTPYPGQGWHLEENPTFAGETLDAPDLIVHDFAGYATEKSISTSFQERKTNITIQSPLTLAKNVPTASQEILEVSTPKTWAEVGKVLSNPVGAYWYITTLHAPYLIDGHDLEFDPVLLIYRRQIFQFQQADAGGQIASLAEMFLGIIGEKSNGRVRMVRNPNYFNNDDRNALDTQWDWTPPDIVGKLERGFSWRMEYGQVHGYAFSFDGGLTSTPYESLAPGRGKSQSPGVKSMTPFIVPNALGALDRPNIIDDYTGHDFAASNSDKPPVVINASGNIDLAEPCDLDQWHFLDVPASFDPDALGWTGERLNPVTISRSWSSERGAFKKVANTFRTETYGLPGEPQPINRGGANTPGLSVWNPGIIQVYQPAFPAVGFSIPAILAWNSKGKLGRTTQFLLNNVSWQNMNLLPGAFTGLVLDVCLVYQSAYFSDSTQPLEAWILTNDSGTLKAWHCSNIFAVNPVFTNPATGRWTLQSTFAGNARIIASRETADFILVGWRDRFNAHYARSIDAGATFAAAANVGATLTGVGDTGHDSDGLGMAVYAAAQIITAPTGAIDTDGAYIYQPYYASATGGAFAAVANVPTDFRTFPGFAQNNSATLAFVGMEKFETAPADELGAVTFDIGGYADYTTDGVISFFGFPSPGDPPNFNFVGQSLSPNPTANGSMELNIIVNMPGDILLSAIDLMRWSSRSGAFAPAVNFQFETIVKGWDGYDGTGELIFTNAETQVIDYGSAAETTLQTAYSVYTVPASALDNIQPVKSITIKLKRTWNSLGIGNLSQFIKADNINIQGVKFSHEKDLAFYSFNPGAGTWARVSPPNVNAPQSPYALSFKYTDLTTAGLIARDEDGHSWLYATPLYTKIGQSHYNGVKVAPSGLILFGTGVLGMTPDLVTTYNRLGNWANILGEIGEIKGVTGVL